MGLLRLFKRSNSASEAECSIEKEKLRLRAATAPHTKAQHDKLTRLAAANLPETHFGLFEKLIQKKPCDFILFLALPEVLRQRIWREAFPRNRDIRLRVQYKQGEYNKIDFGFPPPVTLYVNSESREETLKYYHFFTQEKLFNTSISFFNFKPACYCINPNLDNLSLGFMSLWNSNYSIFFRAMLAEVPNFRKKVRSLEVVDVYQAPLIVDVGNEASIKKFLAENLTRFHYLDEIRFVLAPREQLDSPFVHMWKARIKQAFEREIRKYPHCSVPNIVVVSYEAPKTAKLLRVE